MRVIGIGDNVVDDYAHLRTQFPGGNALNFAVYTHMLGCDAAYLGVFGSDAAAAHVRGTLAKLGIDTSHCRSADGPNGRAELSVEHGERVFLGSNAGGVSQTVPMDFVFDDPDYLRGFAIAHTSAYSYMDAHLPRLHALDALVSYDFSDDFDPGHALSLCPHVDAGFFSCAGWGDDATAGLLENAVHAGCTLAAATRGRDETVLFDGQSWYRQAPRNVTAIDTLGAGDAFIAAFLVTWTRGRQGGGEPPDALIGRALDRAAGFAAETCRVQGAFGHGRRY